MPIDPQNHPEFEETVHTKVLDAVLRLLTEDSSLMDFFMGEIKIIPSEEIRNLGSKKTPSLWVYLLEDLEEAGISRQANVTIQVAILLTYKFGDFTDHRQSLLRRVLGHCQKLIHKDIILRDELGVQLTDSTIGFDRVETAEIDATSRAYVQTLVGIFQSTINQETQLPLSDL